MVVGAFGVDYVTSDRGVVCRWVRAWRGRFCRPDLLAAPIHALPDLREPRR